MVKDKTLIKLNYNPTYTFTTADVFDASETVIEFESRSRLDSRWAALARDWINDGNKDVERAYEMLATALVSVSQDGQRYPLNGREDIEALQAAIEESSPGYGEQFIRHLALGHWNLHFSRISDIVGNLSKPSQPTTNGNAPK